MTIEKHEAGSLALEPDQYEFTAPQKQALVHIGIENASDGDLQVFLHVCKRTGLDPFAKQIYMIGRAERARVNGEWTEVGTKWTIQTGIDGFRLIGRRAADRAHHKVRVDPPEWAKGDEGWRPWWNAEWGTPVAAKVTVWRDGEPFTAVAMFEEYKQLKSGGRLNSMWEQRPAGQIAKCAEALAWRMAFPQDLSGIYSDDEMGQADNHGVVAEQVDERRVSPAAIAAQASGAGDGSSDGAPKASSPEPPAPDPAEEMITEAQFTEIGARLTAAGITDRVGSLLYVNDVLKVHGVEKRVRARKELTRVEAEWVLDALRADEATVAPPAPKDPATEQPEDPWATVEVKQPPDADTPLPEGDAK